MVTIHLSHIFASDDATMLYITIPVQIVSDSQFPVDADDDISVTINDERLVVTEASEETNQ